MFGEIVDNLEARMRATEVLVYSLLRTVQIDDIKAAYKLEKEAALTALLNSATASDTMYSEFERVLAQHEASLGIDAEE